jgi:hypothetical protein
MEAHFVVEVMTHIRAEQRAPQTAKPAHDEALLREAKNLPTASVKRSHLSGSSFSCC